MPADPPTLVTVLTICCTLGDANTLPETAALRRPLPTSAANEGSWPAPPPEISVTCLLPSCSELMIAIVKSLSQRTKLGFGQRCMLPHLYLLGRRSN